jgi:hypothetical protein
MAPTVMAPTVIALAAVKRSDNITSPAIVADTVILFEIVSKKKH